MTAALIANGLAVRVGQRRRRVSATAGAPHRDGCRCNACAYARPRAPWVSEWTSPYAADGTRIASRYYSDPTQAAAALAEIPAAERGVHTYGQPLHCGALWRIDRRVA